MNTVKVGDRVRVTCGESVIVGTVKGRGEEWISVALDGDGDYRRFFALDQWTVEVLPPPIPDVVGTIVRDHSGEAWQREIGVWKCVGGPYRYSLAEVQRRYGPLTVLWPTSDAT